MKWPNFFIIGAPKCGTTSLWAWLSEHPNIFMCPMKEPLFYAVDLKLRKTTSRAHYENLFKEAGDQHIAVGEASATYLFSQVAVPTIEQEIPDPRYIVMIRNPVEMAYSLHGHLLITGEEHISDFERAWRLSPERREGRMVSKLCPEPHMLDYQTVCRLGEQIERLFQVVPKERVLVLLLDDIIKNPRQEYLKVLRFLGVPDDGRKDFPKKNESKTVTMRTMHKLTVWIGHVSFHTKKRLGIPVYKGTGILNFITGLNFRPHRRPPLSERLRQELCDFFRDDVEKLQRLIGRDLSAWINC